MIQIAERRRVRVAGRRTDSRPLAFLKRLDWVLMAAAFALAAYGLWVVSGITRFDVPGDQDYYVMRQAFAAVLGLVGLVAAASSRSTSRGATGASCTARRSGS